MKVILFGKKSRGGGGLLILKDVSGFINFR